MLELKTKKGKREKEDDHWLIHLFFWKILILTFSHFAKKHQYGHRALLDLGRWVTLEVVTRYDTASLLVVRDHFVTTDKRRSLFS